MTVIRLVMLVICGWLATQIVKADITYTTSETDWLATLSAGAQPVEFTFQELPNGTIIDTQYQPDLAFPAPQPRIAIVQAVGGDDHALLAPGNLVIQTPQGAEAVAWELRPGWTTQPWVTVGGVEYAPPWTCAVPPGGSISFCGVSSDDGPIEQVRLVNTLGVDELVDNVFYVPHPGEAPFTACVTGSTVVLSIMLGTPVDVDIPAPGACVTHPPVPDGALRLEFLAP